jgi:Protein of unknown function (DUF1573)
MLKNEAGGLRNPAFTVLDLHARIPCGTGPRGSARNRQREQAMKKWAFTLTILLASAGLTAGQQEAPWANKLFGSKITHDFGTVARGAVLKFSFPIKNIYAEPLTVTEVRPSCGCVTATPSVQTFQAQQEGTLDIAMDTRKFAGQKTVKIYVTFGPKFISTATLEVKANARSDVVLNPGELNFGVVMQGQQPSQTIQVDYAGFIDFKLKELIKPADAPMNVTVVETFRKQPAGNQAGRVSYVITAKLNADAPVGTFKNDLVLKTNDPQSDTLIVTVEGNVQATLSAAPMSLNLGNIKVNVAKSFNVRVSGNRPFHITQIKCDSNDINFNLPAAATQVHTLMLQCRPTAVGQFTRQITIVTDLENNASITITVQGNAQQ